MSMLSVRNIALILGVFYAAIGLLGFVPATLENGQLFGLLAVSPVNNLVHLVTGLVAIWASQMARDSATA